MLHSVHGDILLSKAQATAHGVAPNDNFHSGLALSLRERWPAMYKDFRHFMHQTTPKEGELWAWPTAEGRHIISLFTQAPAPSEHQHPGAATVANVNHALRALAKFIEAEGITSIALPRLATGVGKLNWADVEPLIENHLGGLGIPVIVYSEYEAGVPAPEPL